MFQCLSNFAQKVKARHEKEKAGPFLSAIFLFFSCCFLALKSHYILNHFDQIHIDEYPKLFRDIRYILCILNYMSCFSRTTEVCDFRSHIYIYEDEVLLMLTMLLGQIIMTVYTFQNLKWQDAGGLVITKPDADQPTELGAWSSGQVPFSSQITLTKAAYDSQVC